MNCFFFLVGGTIVGIIVGFVVTIYMVTDKDDNDDWDDNDD